MNSVKRIVLFGCKSTTKFILNLLRGLSSNITLVSIGPKKGIDQKVADYLSLASYCEDNQINCYIANKYSLKTEEDLSFFKENRFDLGFVIGWQRLIPEDILTTFSIGVFGMHGSAMNLPKGRGRSPMNWSILEGRHVFYTNLFKYKAGVDDGDILDTYKFHITSHDTGETMHFKNTLAMKYLIEKNLYKLMANQYTLYEQEKAKPSYYPKRNESDSLIDWTDDITQVERLIRAVSKPFNGAYTFVNGQVKLIIDRAIIFDSLEYGYVQSRPGEILAIFHNGKFIVKAKGGTLLVHEYQTNQILKVGDQLNNGTETKKQFPRNDQGYFDIE